MLGQVKHVRIYQVNWLLDLSCHQKRKQYMCTFNLKYENLPGEEIPIIQLYFSVLSDFNSQFMCFVFVVNLK